MGKKNFAAVDRGFAEHVLYYLGDTNLGVKPAPRQSALIHTIRFCVADRSPAGKDYLEALRREFPEYVHLMEVLTARGYDDIEPLRRFVRDGEPSLLDVLPRVSSQAGLASIRGGL